MSSNDPRGRGRGRGRGRPRPHLGARGTRKTSERPQILQEAWMQQRSHEWVFFLFFFSFIYQHYRQAPEPRAVPVLPPRCGGLLARGFGRGLRYSRTRRIQNSSFSRKKSHWNLTKNLHRCPKQPQRRGFASTSCPTQRVRIQPKKGPRSPALRPRQFHSTRREQLPKAKSEFSPQIGDGVGLWRASRHLGFNFSGLQLSLEPSEGPSPKRSQNFGKWQSLLSTPRI